MTTIKTYLGNGIWAAFDGFQFVLRSESGADQILLKPGETDCFLRFVEHCLKVKIHAEEAEETKAA